MATNRASQATTLRRMAVTTREIIAYGSWLLIVWSCSHAARMSVVDAARSALAVANVGPAIEPQWFSTNVFSQVTGRPPEGVNTPLAVSLMLLCALSRLLPTLVRRSLTVFFDALVNDTVTVATRMGLGLLLVEDTWAPLGTSYQATSSLPAAIDVNEKL